MPTASSDILIFTTNLDTFSLDCASVNSISRQTKETSTIAPVPFYCLDLDLFAVLDNNYCFTFKESNDSK